MRRGINALAYEIVRDRRRERWFRFKYWLLRRKDPRSYS